MAKLTGWVVTRIADGKLVAWGSTYGQCLIWARANGGEELYRIRARMTR
jgi:hypothetical protein